MFWTRWRIAVGALIALSPVPVAVVVAATDDKRGAEVDSGVPYVPETTAPTETLVTVPGEGEAPADVAEPPPVATEEAPVAAAAPDEIVEAPGGPTTTVLEAATTTAPPTTECWPYWRCTPPTTDGAPVYVPPDDSTEP